MSSIRKLWDDDNEDWVLVDDSGTEYDYCSSCSDLFPLSELDTMTAACVACQDQESDTRDG